jgi:hypothetical protein
MNALFHDHDRISAQFGGFPAQGFLNRRECFLGIADCANFAQPGKDTFRRIFQDRHARRV